MECKFWLIAGRSSSFQYGRHRAGRTGSRRRKYTPTSDREPRRWMLIRRRAREKAVESTELNLQGERQ